MKISIEPLNIIDTLQIIDIYNLSINTISAPYYTKTQIQAWAIANPDIARWEKRIVNYYGLKAIFKNKIIGFADCKKNSNQVGRLYVHPDYIKNQVGRMLLNSIEQYIFNQNFEFITLNSTINAVAFYIKNGYEIVVEKSIIFNGQNYLNTEMIKYKHN